MNDIEQVLAKAETNLNEALYDFESTTSSLAKDFQELKLQATIFQYDICIEMMNLHRNKPSGFARSVALKGLVHKLYEYNKLLNNHLIRKMLLLATSRGIAVDRKEIKELRKKWKTEFEKLQRWIDVRNEATGHYGQDIARQVSLIKKISSDEVMLITAAFLRFNMGILLVLKNAGVGSSA